MLIVIAACVLALLAFAAPCLAFGYACAALVTYCNRRA